MIHPTPEEAKKILKEILEKLMGDIESKKLDLSRHGLHSRGICRYIVLCCENSTPKVSSDLVHNELFKLYRDWNHYTGYAGYPVGYRNCHPIHTFEAFLGTTDFWYGHPYGEARQDLIRFALSRL